MNNINNCSRCQIPLTNWMNKYLFPCKHQIHRSCLVNWMDQIHREKPQERTVNCPICRKASVLPTKHSADQIISWVDCAKKTILVGGLIFGSCLGILIERFGKGYSPLIERMYKISSQLIDVPPVLPISLTLGSSALFGGWILTRSSFLTRITTSIYNRIHETNIQSQDIWLHGRSGLLKSSGEEQVLDVCFYYLNQQLLLMKNEIELIFNDKEKEIELLKQIRSKFSELEQNLKEINHSTNQFIEELKSERGDLFAQLKQIGCRLLGSQENDECKDELILLADEYLLKMLDSDQTVVLHDVDTAIHLALIIELEMNKDLIDDKNKIKKQEWVNLLEFFKNQIRNPDKKIINELKEELRNNSTLSLIENEGVNIARVLRDNGFGEDLFEALMKTQDEVFIKKGFFLNKNRS